MIETIQWTESGVVVMLDQRRLPHDVRFVTCNCCDEVAEAIRSMVIRGAPAIGIAAAMGLALAVRAGDDFEAACKVLGATRPTAVNLSWAIERMRAVFRRTRDAGTEELTRRMIEETQSIYAEDLAVCRAIGTHGEPLIPDGCTVLTHCNAGALGTAGYGTALGMIRAAVSAGKVVDVFADETRPFLQGARLTAWELMRDGIATTVITDNMAGHFLSTGRIGCVVVGADRIAANGDVANKIGTYSVAVLARENNVPFYVAAPVSTFDLATSSGDHIPIERRSGDEVRQFQGVSITPDGVAVENPAFDITPARYISAIVCENGVALPPYEESLLAFASRAPGGRLSAQTP